MLNHLTKKHFITSLFLVLLAISALTGQTNNYGQSKVAGKDTMFLYSSVSIDSVPFSPGIYNIPAIPDDYVDLFSLHPEDGMKIMNRDIAQFKIAKRQYHAKPGGLKLNYTHILGGAIIKNCMQFPEYKTLVCLGKKGIEDCLLISRDNGKTWNTKYFYVPNSFKSSFPLIPFNADCYYWLGGDYARNRSVAMVLDSTGKVTMDSALSSIQAYSLKFCKDKSAFALCRHGKGNSALYRSLDNGHTWSLMDSTLKGYDAFIINFFDKNTGYLRITVPPNKQEILQTENGGITWNIYTPKTTAFNINNQSLVYCNEEGRYYSSTLKGKDLNKVNFGIKGLWLSKALFLNDQTGILMNWKYLLLTKDGCKSWTYIPTHAVVSTDNCNNGITDAIMINESQVLLFSSSGVYSGIIEK